MQGAEQRAGIVLYVDDEPQNLELFRLQFEEELEVVTAGSGEEALAVLAKAPIAVLLSDERMPGMRGVDLLAEAARRWPDVVRVIVSAYGDAPRLLAAINLGHAHEYVLKPWDQKELGACIERALTIATRRRSLEDVAARAVHIEADAAAVFGRIVGDDGDLAPALAIARRAAPSAVPVLVTGEHGTGKELVARFLHAQSRRSGAFLRLACAHVAPDRIAAELFGSEQGELVVRGRLESASHGTLFLDGVAELPLALQAELARAVDEGAFERVGGRSNVPLTARLLGSTHRNLEALVADDRFSSSLRYHFNVVVALPPLRGRVADIAPLALHFAGKHTRPGDPPHGIDEEALAALAAYAWPGNVRELESLVARAVALAGSNPLTIDDFTFRLDIGAPSAGAPSAREEARANETAELRRLLLAHGGNLARAARATNVPRTTLLSRAKKLGLLS